jgi:molybdopterin-synthase adenylyltransferase
MSAARGPPSQAMPTMSIRGSSQPLERPRLKRTVKLLETADGHILLTRCSGDDVRVPDPGREGRELLGALDGQASTTDLARRFGANLVDSTIAGLRELSLVEDAADDDLLPPAERERFDRQLRYFSEVDQGRVTPSECQQRLRDARVAVLGIGGLGGRAALELACGGVGGLRLVDGDLVELSNLDRQIQYEEADVGKRKVDAAASRLRAFNSSVQVETVFRRIEGESDLAEVIAGVDLVIGAADWPAHEIEFWFNSACFAAGIPYIGMSHCPPLARIGPLYVPGKTGCYACEDARDKREYPLYANAVEQLRGTSSPAGTVGPPCGVIGGFVGMEAMHLLTGVIEPATLGVAHTIDMRTMEVERKPVQPDPGCPVCADLQPTPGS